MSVLLFAAAPTQRSRASALLDAAHDRMAGGCIEVERLHVRDLPAHEILSGDTANRAVADAIDQVRRADALVIATPVYQGSFSGLLKVFLDLLPAGGLAGKVVLPLSVGPLPGPLPAIESSLGPVLEALAARQVLPGVHASESQIHLTACGPHHIAPEVTARLDVAVARLLHAAGQADVAHGWGAPAGSGWPRQAVPPLGPLLGSRYASAFAAC